MIIDYTYFKGLLSIGLSPDTGAPSFTLEAERERISQFIDIYEEEYLRKLLGGKYDEYISSIESEEWLPVTEYLRKDYSPIACYVFFKYVSVGNIQVTRVGSVTSAEDSVVSPMQLQIRAWNDMVVMNRHLAYVLRDLNICVDDSLLCMTNDMGI